ncbi:uncharacterized protein LOC143652653 [Tamandua tetradactyla]|uniref:uncharacterized protein LOC143652653 n=1 Tax=Tamandua tetradactyla TaxID=48850 RepID=UPI0040545082
MSGTRGSAWLNPLLPPPRGGPGWGSGSARPAVPAARRRRSEQPAEAGSLRRAPPTARGSASCPPAWRPPPPGRSHLLMEFQNTWESGPELFGRACGKASARTLPYGPELRVPEQGPMNDTKGHQDSKPRVSSLHGPSRGPSPVLPGSTPNGDVIHNGWPSHPRVPVLVQTLPFHLATCHRLALPVMCSFHHVHPASFPSSGWTLINLGSSPL